MKYIVVSLLFVGCAGVFSVQRTDPQPMVVVGSDATLHKVATWGHAIKTLQPGGRVTVIGSENAYWYAIAGTDTGFVDKGDLATPEEAAAEAATKAQEAETMAQSLEVTVPNADAPTAWARANQFIAQHSDMKMQTATDLLLETFNPTGPALFGYQITKVPLRDSVQISVSCTYDPGTLDLDKDHANENAHVAAYFIRTGKLTTSLLH